MPALHLPDWFVSAVAFLLIIGFPIAIVLAWAFELTPDGLKAESKADSADSEPRNSGQHFNYIVIATLVLAVGYFVIDKFALDASPEPAGTAAESQAPGQELAETPAVQIDKSIAVLPFVNMSSDAEQEYFSDGLAEELLNLLSQIPDLKVAARSSSFSFKNKALEVSEIATRLNVAHVLEGSVRKHDKQLRITAQLVQADNGFQLWSETYDRQLDNVFDIQEEIATAVVDSLRITLLGEAPKARKTDPKAYQYFLEGQYLQRQLKNDSMLRAIGAFRKAIEIDPFYVPALAQLADTYVWVGRYEDYTWDELTALTDQAVRTAIETDPNYAFAYYVRGISSIWRKMKFKDGLEDFEHAHELDPGDAFLVAAIGKGAFLTGQYDLAITQYQKALAMEPVVPEFHWFLGNAYLSAGRLDEAEASFRKLLDLSPSYRGRYRLWETLLLQGELDEALTLATTAYRRAVTHDRLGNSAQSDAALAEQIASTSNDTHDDAYITAMIHAYRGDADQAFESLNHYLANYESPPVWILVEPAFQSLHSDERWPAVLERLGLLEYWEAMVSNQEA